MNGIANTEIAAPIELLKCELPIIRHELPREIRTLELNPKLIPEVRPVCPSADIVALSITHELLMSSSKLDFVTAIPAIPADCKPDEQIINMLLSVTFRTDDPSSKLVDEVLHE